MKSTFVLLRQFQTSYKIKNKETNKQRSASIKKPTPSNYAKLKRKLLQENENEDSCIQRAEKRLLCVRSPSCGIFITQDKKSYKGFISPTKGFFRKALHW